MIIFNGDNLVHVPMSLRARTSALDLWLSVIKWTKVNCRSLLGDPENELHLVVVCCDSCSPTQYCNTFSGDLRLQLHAVSVWCAFSSPTAF